MRILKFRVWDKMETRFIYPDKGYQGHFMLTLDGKFQNLQNGSSGDDYVIQQFTGFKDSVANDIYEGDILIQETFKPDGNEILHWIVSYDEKSASFITKCIEYGNVELLFFRSWKEENPYSFQVIGNIFENRE